MRLSFRHRIFPRVQVPTLLVRWANFEVDALERVGFQATKYLRANGFAVSREPGWGRMPWPVVVSMWKAAERRTRDANLGLHAAAAIPLEQPGFVALYVGIALFELYFARLGGFHFSSAERNSSFIFLEQMIVVPGLAIVAQDLES